MQKGDAFARGYSGHYAKALDAGFRIRALLRCAATGIAVERFRQLTDGWPASLAEIPKTILPSIPLDPFDGQPLRYIKRDDGVTVYSIGADEQDDGGKFPDGARLGDNGTDLVFRLYDAAHRGKPALPKPKRFEDDEFDLLEPEFGPMPRVVDGK
jgi:hypothetical protein